MLELAYQDFKTPIINMFKDFFLKTNLMSEQMGTLCWKPEIIFKNPMEILELTNIIPVLGRSKGKDL